MNNKLILRFLRIVFTTTLLINVFHRAGLTHLQGWQSLFNTLANANLFFITLSLAITPLVDFASSFKWYCLTRARNLSVSLWRLYAYYIVGQFFNLVLPSSIGGDVVRVNQLGHYTGRYADAAAAVFVERFSGLATLVMLALVVVIIKLEVFSIAWLITALIISVVAMAFLCYLVVDQTPLDFLQSYFRQRVPLLIPLFNKVEKFRAAVLLYKNKPEAIGLALINSLLFYILTVVNIWVSSLAFDVTIDFLDILMAAPVILFIMNLPFSVGGIGLMEFAFTFTLGLFNINPVVAISTTLLIRIKTLLGACMGGFLYPLVNKKKAPLYTSKCIDNAYMDKPDL